MEMIIQLLLPFFFHFFISETVYLLFGNTFGATVQTMLVCLLTLPVLIWWRRKDLSAGLKNNPKNYLKKNPGNYLKKNPEKNLNNQKSGFKFSSKAEQTSDEKRRKVIHCVLWALTGAAANFILSSIFKLLPFVKDPMEGIQGQLLSGSIPLQLLTLVVLVPVTEEILFRGLLYCRTAKLAPKWFAAVLTAGLFALYHGNLQQAVFAFPMGLLLAFAMEKEQALSGPVCVHMGSNLAAVLWAIL